MSLLLMALVLGADIGSPLPPIVEQRFQAIEADVVQLKLDVESLKRDVSKCDPPPVAKAKPVEVKLGCVCGENCNCDTGGMDCGCIATSVHLQKDPEVKASPPPTMATVPHPEVRYVQRRVCDGRGQCHFETIAVASQPSVSTTSVYTSSAASECSSCGTSGGIMSSGGGCAGGSCGASSGRGGGPLKAIGRAMFGGKNR